jgi:transposase-like protein
MKQSKTKYRSKTEREAILAAFHVADAGQREFCLEHGITVSTLQYWLRKAREASTAPETQCPASAFVEVKIGRDAAALARPQVESQQSECKCEYDVVLRSGERLVVRSGFEPGEVAALLSVLEAR